MRLSVLEGDILRALRRRFVLCSVRVPVREHATQGPACSELFLERLCTTGVPDADLLRGRRAPRARKIAPRVGYLVDGAVPA